MKVTELQTKAVSELTQDQIKAVRRYMAARESYEGLEQQLNKITARVAVIEGKRNAALELVKQFEAGDY